MARSISIKGMRVGGKEYSWCISLATGQPGSDSESCLDWPAGPQRIQSLLLILLILTTVPTSGMGQPFFLIWRKE